MHCVATPLLGGKENGNLRSGEETSVSEIPYYWATQNFREGLPVLKKDNTSSLYVKGDLTRSVEHAKSQKGKDGGGNAQMSEKTQCIFNLLVEYGLKLDGTRLEWVLQQGTLLSAIRHAGYNPYDYDADIGVYYEKDEDYRVIEAAVGKKHPKGLHYSFLKRCGRNRKEYHVDIVGLIRNEHDHSMIDSLTSQDIFHNIPVVEKHNIYTTHHSGQRYTIPRDWVFPRVRCTIHGLIFPCYHQSIPVLHSFYGTSMIDVIRSRKPGNVCHKDDEAGHNACYATHTFTQQSLRDVREAYQKGDLYTLLDLPSLALSAISDGRNPIPRGAKPFGPLVFMHLRKSGGSTMRGLFWDHQSEGGYQVQNEVEKWTQLPDGDRKLIKISHEDLDRFTITQPCYRCFFGISRDPITRILSLYNYRKCMDQIPRNLGFVAWFKTRWGKDFLTHQLAGRTFRKELRNVEHLESKSVTLERAKHNVRERFFAYGILEQWDDSLRLFRLLRPDYFPSLEYRRINTHKDKNKIKWESLRKEDQDYVRNVLRWDIELHEWLVDRFNRQIQTLKARGLWKQDAVKVVKSIDNGQANKMPHYLLNVGKLAKCDSSYDPSSSEKVTIANPNFHPQGRKKSPPKGGKHKQWILKDDTVGEYLSSL
jgi:hypothetical protein